MYVKTAVVEIEAANRKIEMMKKEKREMEPNINTALKRIAPTYVGINIVTAKRTHESDECIFFSSSELQLLWLSARHQPRIEVVVAGSIDADVMIDHSDELIG